MITPATVSGAYGVGVAAVLAAALGLVVLSSINRTGGASMTDRRRARVLAGVAFLGLAAIVGLVGYLKLSLERDVNRQIPYMASAGMALVILSAIGAALIVAEQLRADETRLQELERAVTMLAGALSSSIEAPARRTPIVAALATEVALATRPPAKKAPARRAPPKRTAGKRAPAKKAAARKASSRRS